MGHVSRIVSDAKVNIGFIFKFPLCNMLNSQELIMCMSSKYFSPLSKIVVYNLSKNAINPSIKNKSVFKFSRRETH